MTLGKELLILATTDVHLWLCILTLGQGQSSPGKLLLALVSRGHIK